MLRGRNSSSEDEDQNFQGQNFKKIDYDGAFDSDNPQSYNDESLSQSQLKRMSKLNKNNTSNKSLSQQDKSRAIKKNRQSAKMSRLRKKEYQEKLQQKVSELQSQISQRKIRIRNTTDLIFAKILRSNYEKFKYLNAKIASSKLILQIMREINSLRLPSTKQAEISNVIAVEHQTQLFKNEYQPFFPNEFSQNLAEISKTELAKSKSRKKKGEEKQEESRHGFEEKIIEKELQLEICLKNYMYEFGMKGCLRMDIIERCKYDWLQTLKLSKLDETHQIQNAVRRMKSCLERLENKSKLLDFHLRELREKIKIRYAVQFMLDREFFDEKSREGTERVELRTIEM